MEKFAAIVDEIRKWDEESLSELESIIQKQIVLKRRKEIHKNYQQARREEKAGSLKFTSDLAKLRKALR